MKENKLAPAETASKEAVFVLQKEQILCRLPGNAVPHRRENMI